MDRLLGLCTSPTLLANTVSQNCTRGDSSSLSGQMPSIFLGQNASSNSSFGINFPSLSGVDETIKSPYDNEVEFSLGNQSEKKSGSNAENQYSNINDNNTIPLIQKSVSKTSGDVNFLPTFGLGDAMERDLGVESLMGLGTHGYPLSIEKRIVKRRLRRYEHVFESIHGMPVADWSHIKYVEEEFLRYNELRNIEDAARMKAMKRISKNLNIDMDTPLPEWA